MITILIGSDTSNTGVYSVDAFETHPLYDSSLQKNDIAIIRSATQIYFNADIGPVCLPIRETYETFAGQLVTLLGKYLKTDKDQLDKLAV